MLMGAGNDKKKAWETIRYLLNLGIKKWTVYISVFSLRFGP
jgi:hypothetical protein